MAVIFEEPMFVNGQAGSVVLMYGSYIIGNISVETADLSIESINKGIFNPAVFETILNINDVKVYEFEVKSDFDIMFKVVENSEVLDKKISFENVFAAEEAEKAFKNHFEQLGLKREEVQLTSLKAAVSPAITTFWVAAGGVLLTWLAYDAQNYVPTNQKVKWYVLLFNKVAQTTGHLPFLIITVLLILICLIWLVRRMMNPPFKISAIK